MPSDQGRDRKLKRKSSTALPRSQLRTKRKCISTSSKRVNGPNTNYIDHYKPRRKANKYFGTRKALYVRNVLDICILRLLGANIPSYRPEVTFPPSHLSFLYGVCNESELLVLNNSENEKAQVTFPPLNTKQLGYLSKTAPHRFHNIYTDGSFYKRLNSSGYAIFWGKNHPNNAFGPVPQRGQLSSAKAEEYAIFLALLLIKAHVQKEESKRKAGLIFRVLTDCAWALDDIKRWYRRWSKPTTLVGWKTAPSSSTEHREILRVTAGILWDLRHRGVMVILGWVKGHHGVDGNEIADQMAKFGGKSGKMFGPEPLFIEKPSSMDSSDE